MVLKVVVVVFAEMVVIMMMAIMAWMTLRRRGTVEPNLRNSWISTVSPQT